MSVKSGVVGRTESASTSFSRPRKERSFCRTATRSPSQRKSHGKAKPTRTTKRVESKNGQGTCAGLRKDADPPRVSDRGRKSQSPPKNRKLAQPKDDLCFVPTWHPAYLFRDYARGGRSFLLHVQKAVEIALGKKADKLPKILRDPDTRTARKIFKAWEKEGWAVDVETPGLREYRLLSVAVCGSRDLAMVWNCEKPSRLTALREALAGPARKIVQNGDFDINVFLECGFETDPETFWDTMIEGAIMHPDEPVNLSFLASMATDIESWKWRREGDLFTYNVIDAWSTWMIYLQNQINYEEESWG